MKFDSLPEHVSTVDTGIGDLREYPQVLRGSPAYVHSLGHGPLNRLVDIALASLLPRWSQVSIDTRLSMLMPGMYPCIPGWHCDDFYRPAGGQPDLVGAPDIEHIMVILGNCSRTRFVSESIELPKPEGDLVYADIDRWVNVLAPKTLCVSSGEFWKFSQISLHRGEPSTEVGWRYFMRLTGSNHWQPLNQRRTQTQVYVVPPFIGW